MSNTEKINYNAFLDDTSEVKDSKNDGLKISNKKSMFSKQSKQPSQQDFDNQVAAYKKNDLEIKNKIAELSIQYKSFILDKTLSSQKNVLRKEQEKEAIRELSNIALQLDSDDTKPEGTGSVGLATLLMQMLLIQRDTINDLSYQINVLNKKLEDK